MDVKRDKTLIIHLFLWLFQMWWSLYRYEEQSLLLTTESASSGEKIIELSIKHVEHRGGCRSCWIRWLHAHLSCRNLRDHYVGFVCGRFLQPSCPIISIRWEQCNNGAYRSGRTVLSLGVTLDGDGYLFIVDQRNHRVIGSGPGGYQCVVGCSGSYGSTSDQLNYPSTMSFDSVGNIFVSDCDNHRIQKFSLIIWSMQ